ncbi:MAG: glycerol-3-phosphate 1-O-acyltransferase PlsY [Firmicutes bacterium]|nr:glycerol-3-phosphate 1-O-acyltransferase PlsY [Dethiobacter sp.]MBS3889389.1 glycerol-3-phosphate 1-O-acyltransferase PlsY [Bacillota bacterium]MBS4054808.1 glycerol-3-phosphate 1-O-acyltransferase PlsY [Thermaerobacter sp.]
MILMHYGVALIVAYLVGAFPTAYVVGKTRNIDITRHGSGNVGGTNALRVMGVGPGVTVALCDFLKAAVPTYLATQVADIALWQVLTIAAATVIGHNWSVYIGFRGGKGIACTIGVSAILYTPVLLASLAVAALVMYLTRYVSVGSLLMTTLIPVILFLWRFDAPYIVFALFIMVLAFYRHRSNIVRLMQGTENKLGKSKK